MIAHYADPELVQSIMQAAALSRQLDAWVMVDHRPAPSVALIVKGDEIHEYHQGLRVRSGHLATISIEWLP
jgi:hypothetical protein